MCIKYALCVLLHTYWWCFLCEDVHSLLTRLRMSAFLSGCVVDLFVHPPLFFKFGTWCASVRALCVTAALRKPTQGYLLVSTRRPTLLLSTGYQHKQTSENHRGGRWYLSMVLSVCVCVCSWLGGLCSFSKHTIWVMVGIQGRVVAIDFSAFTVHCSKLRPDGRSVSFCSVYLLEEIKDCSSCICPLTRCASL